MSRTPVPVVPEPDANGFPGKLAPLFCAVVTACLAFFAMQTLHWPLVGDAALVDYAVFLLDHGFKPYQQIIDVQLPGTYLMDWAVVHLFGGGSAGLRAFDYLLDLGVIVAMVMIAWPTAPAAAGSCWMGRFFRDGRYAAYVAGGVFVLAHGRDGLLQSGQRDLAMAVLLLMVYAAAFHSLRGNRPILLALAACSAASAAAIKPTIAPAVFFVMLLALVQVHRKRWSMQRYGLAAIAGGLLPVAAIAIFLTKEGVCGAFFEALRTVFPYHASLGRRSVGYLLKNGISPVQPLLYALAAVLLLQLCLSMRARRPLAIFRKKSWSWEDLALGAGLVLAWLSYFLQGKGFPYQRYPFLAVLLLVMMLHFHRTGVWAMGRFNAKQKPLARALGVVSLLGLMAAALFLAPVSTYKISQFDWRSDSFYQDLHADLDSVGGSRLSGHVQCLDAFAGCIDVLYRMGLVQNSGFLVDFYLLAEHPNSFVLKAREGYWQHLQQDPPAVFVVTEQTFPRSLQPAYPYEKLARWPDFSAYLSQHYRLVQQRDPGPRLWTSHLEYPGGYRIYVRKP